MRGIGLTFSRLFVPRALLAGAALFAGAMVEQAYAESTAASDEVAMANPRPHAGAGVALPQPLPPSEAQRLRRIFALQARGAIPAALQDTAALDLTGVGQAMLGHVLADRYLGRFTRPDAPTLLDWLARWPGLPDAADIHDLLHVRAPRGSHLPMRPAAPRLTEAPPVPEESEAAGAALPRNPALERSVQAAAHNGPRAAQRLIAGSRAEPSYAALLRGQAARVLFTLNRDAEAYSLGAAGSHVCAIAACQEAALPSFVAGLAAWRMDEAEPAGRMFEASWRAGVTTPAQQAAAAWWAARVRLRLGDYAGFRPWAMRAAAQPSTFYGQVARRALGLGPGLAGSGEVLAQADVDAIAATPGGLRGFALLQIGQLERAEAEFRRLAADSQGDRATGDLALTRAIMLVADRAGLVDLAAALADLVQAADGRPRAVTRFAVPRLRPAGGFTIDPALVYALARAESNFDANLVSTAGARGMMQIMPDTARFISGAAGLHGMGEAWRDPADNLALGQRYVSYLATHDVVGGDLIRLLASYNAGPGNFGHWSAGLNDRGDPLLFIEAIPVDETRAFVPRVLTYTWLYAARLHLPAPSLDDLAVGNWPRYHAPEQPIIH